MSKVKGNWQFREGENSRIGQEKLLGETQRSRNSSSREGAGARPRRLGIGCRRLVSATGCCCSMDVDITGPGCRGSENRGRLGGNGDSDCRSETHFVVLGVSIKSRED